jgi:hypothetical protein
MTRKLGLLAAISVFVTIIFTAPGCNSGCLDRFDCKGDAGTGKDWQCASSTCASVP